MTPRREIIATLLEWYQDVLNPWTTGGSGEGGFPMMNPILNHPSYRELERLLPELRDSEPATYWNLAQRYIYAPTKPVLRCSSCGPHPESAEYGILHPRDEHQRPNGDIRFHQHGRKVVTLRPVRVRVPSLAIRTELVDRGIVWLDHHWAGEPFIPDFEAKVVAA